MTGPEYERWQRRYGEAAGHLFGEAPNAFLASCRDALPVAGSRALAVADGDGRNGVWLAEQGLSVVSLDFSDVAQDGARRLAAQRGVTLDLVTADVHHWDYPAAVFDLVVEVFAQFSTPPLRARKWAGMLRALKPGGVLIVQGYTPAQLAHGTGGPKALDQLYTQSLLRGAFGSLHIDRMVEQEADLDEGEGHRGRSAVIGMVARKPAE